MPSTGDSAVSARAGTPVRADPATCVPFTRLALPSPFAKRQPEPMQATSCRDLASAVRRPDAGALSTYVRRS